MASISGTLSSNLGRTLYATVGDSYTLRYTSSDTRNVYATGVTSGYGLSLYNDGASNWVGVSGTLTKAGTAYVTVAEETEDGITTHTITFSITGTTKVTSISISGSTSVEVGNSITLTANALPTNATNRGVSWTITSGSSYATLSSATALKVTVWGESAGTVKIKATALDGSGVSATYTVLVTDSTVKVTSISLSALNTSPIVGGGTLVNATVSPSNASNKSLKWSVVSGSAYISGGTIGSSCTVLSNSTGSSTVRASAMDGSGVYKDMTIRWSSKVAATSINLSSTSVTVVEGNNAYVTVSLSPSNTTDNAYVDRGTGTDKVASASITNSTIKIYGISVGSTTITIQAIDSDGTTVHLTKDIAVTVVADTSATLVESIWFANTPTTTLDAGKSTGLITAYSSPTDADNGKLVASIVSGSSVIKFNGSVNEYDYGCSFSITGVSEGTGVVRIAATDGSGVYTDLTFTVSATPRIEWTYVANPYKLYVNQTASIHATATNPIVSLPGTAYSIVSGSEYITLSPGNWSATITGKAVGTAIVRATRTDDSSYYADLTVNVVMASASAYPHESSFAYTYYTGKTYGGSAGYTPMLGTGKVTKIHGGYITVYPPEGCQYYIDGTLYSSIPSYVEGGIDCSNHWVGLEGKPTNAGETVYFYGEGTTGTSQAQVSVLASGQYNKSLLFREYTPEGCTMTGSLPDDIVVADVGEEYTFKIPECTAAIKGYVLLGWTTDPETTDFINLFSVKASVPTQSTEEYYEMTLYPEWYPCPDGFSYENLQFSRAFPLKKAVEVEIPNRKDYPMKTSASSDPVEGLKYTLNGTTYDGEVPDVSMTSGVLKITGTPSAENETGYTITQKSPRGYNLNYILTALDESKIITVSISGPSTLYLGFYGTYTATVSNSSTVTWSSSNTSAATIDEDGKATALALGSTIIRAVSDDDPTVYDEMTVSVVSPDTPDPTPSTDSDTNCWLRVTLSDGSTKYMYLSEVTGITRAYNVSLQEASTMVYGYRERFVTDLGTSEKITMKISRANPPDYDDDSDDQADWSNAKWLAELKDMLDFWQNFGYDKSTGKRTGGYTLHFDPPKDAEELYPAFEKNVFFQGSMTVNHNSVQKLSLTLPFQVGSMIHDGSTSGSTTVSFRSAVIGGVTMPTFTRSFAPDALQVLPMPDLTWTKKQSCYMFHYWAESSEYSENETRYYPGTMVEPGRTVWYARWREPIGDAQIITFDTAESKLLNTIGFGFVSIPTGATRAMVYAVGGGGGGGSGSVRYTNAAGIGGSQYYLAGGAGGSGEFSMVQISLLDNDSLFYMVGRGGNGSSSSITKNGAAGEDGWFTALIRGSESPTSTTLEGEDVLVSAQGGKGGQANTSGTVGDASATDQRILNNIVSAAGGSSYYAGGASASDFTSRGEDGKSGDGTRYGKGSAGHSQGVIATTQYLMGGGGGGAADLNHSFLIGGNLVLYQSIGGDGGYNGADDGEYGGGGGSTGSGKSGDGGDGFLAIVFF